MRRPPVRWTATELPDNLARALSSAGSTPEDDVAVARMRARLSHALGPSFEGRAAEGHPSTSKLALRSGPKWLAAGALIAAGLAVLGLRSAYVKHAAAAQSGEQSPSASDAPQSARVETNIAFTTVDSANELTQSGDDPQAQALQPSDMASEQPRRVASAQPKDVASAQPKDVASAQPKDVASVKPKDAAAAQRKDVAAAQRKDVAAAQRKDVAAAQRKNVAAAQPRGRRSPQRTSPAQSGLAEELRGIEHIRELMGASPARALAETRAQQRRFAHGALAPERELLRVEALLRMGRIAEAKARAHAQGAPSDPYRQQLEKLLAAHRE